MPEPPPTIRAARADESVAIQAIDVAAGRQFVDVGLADVAADPPLPTELLEQCRRGGWSWVAVDGADRPVAFLVAGPVDGHAHVHQVSVHPDQARRGIGRALIDHLAAAAASRSVAAVTLTTFAGVPWNAPYYARCGFRRLDDGDLGPELALIRRNELVRLDRLHPRLAMIRLL